MRKEIKSPVPVEPLKESQEGLALVDRVHRPGRLGSLR